jgi:hypothetical protein
MPTPAYTALDTTKPVISNSRSSDLAAMNGNQLAVRDGIVMGRIPGFTLSVSGGTAEEPQYRVWTKSAEKLRATYTYSSGYVTQVVWEWSNDTGGTYSAIATETVTYDGSNNQTAGNNSSLLSWLYEWIGKLKALRTAYNAHVAATGTAVHGLGSISTQAANSVAITGGSVNGAAVGTTTPAEGLFTRAAEQYNTYTPGSGAAQALDWAKGGSSLTNNGANTVSFSNVPASRVATHALYCSVFNSTTFPAAVTWGLGGKPSIAGKALVSLVTLDGGTTVYAGIMWREN